MLALWRQRAYADRTGTPFVFLRVGLNGPRRAGESEAWNERLGELAGDVCRGSDAVGWCDERKGRMGLLLPGATEQGALRVVREVESALRARVQEREGAPEVLCELFIYPGPAYEPALDWAVGGLDAERV